MIILQKIEIYYYEGTLQGIYTYSFIKVLYEGTLQGIYSYLKDIFPTKNKEQYQVTGRDEEPGNLEHY